MPEPTITDLDNATPEQLEEMLTELTSQSDAPPAEETAVVEQNTPEAEEQPETNELETLKQQVEELKKANERNEKQLKDKEVFIQKRSQEIGELRKQLAAKREALINKVERDIPEDEIINDPKAALKKALREQQSVSEELEHLNKQDKELAIEQARQQHSQLIQRMIPGLPDIEEDILSVIKADYDADEGVDEQTKTQMLSQFKENLAERLNPAVLFQLARRARDQKIINELRAEIEQLKSAPDKLTTNINKFAGKAPVTAAPASPKKGAISLKNLTEADIDKMSLEELAELEKQFIRS